jgi:RNA polymerase sigma-70 factor (ECF subfamily)
MRIALRKAVASLEEKYRIPVVLYYFDEQNIGFISNTMKIPEGTVKSRLHKARTLIGEALKKEGFDSE